MLNTKKNKIKIWLWTLTVFALVMLVTYGASRLLIRADTTTTDAAHGLKLSTNNASAQIGRDVSVKISAIVPTSIGQIADMLVLSIRNDGETNDYQKYKGNINPDGQMVLAPVSSSDAANGNQLVYDQFDYNWTFGSTTTAGKKYIILKAYKGTDPTPVATATTTVNVTISSGGMTLSADPTSLTLASKTDPTAQTTASPQVIKISISYPAGLANTAKIIQLEILTQAQADAGVYDAAAVQGRWTLQAGGATETKDWNVSGSSAGIYYLVAKAWNDNNPANDSKLMIAKANVVKVELIKNPKDVATDGSGGVTQADLGVISLPGKITDRETFFFVFVGLVKYAIWIAAVLGMIYGGIMLIQAAGDQTKLQKAKKIIIGSIIGLLIAIFGPFLVNVVINVFGG